MENKKKFALIDIGGTFTKIRVLKLENKNLKRIAERKENINNYDDLKSFLASFLKLKLNYAIVSLAGPVFGNSGFMTNWEGKPEINSNKLKKILKIKNITLLNDMEAQGYGLIYLMEKEILFKNLKEIYKPQKIKEKENMALIIPGTGLGSCFIYKNEVLPMELQHSTFFPLNKKVKNLYFSFLQKGTYPSYENFVSGAGLFDIYFNLKNFKEFNKNIKDKADYVRKKAEKGEKEAIEAIEIYFYVLAQYLQAVALSVKPFSGIFIGGGGVKKNFKFFKKENFLKIYFDNPKQKKLLQKIPIFFIEKDLIFEGLLYFMVKYLKIFGGLNEKI
jgi:glucokinase